MVGAQKPQPKILSKWLNALHRTLTYERNRTHLTHFSRKISVRTNYGDHRTEERFQTMLQQMKEMDEQYKRFSDLFEDMSKAQTAFYNVQVEFTRMQMAAFKRDNDM